MSERRTPSPATFELFASAWDCERCGTYTSSPMLEDGSCNVCTTGVSDKDKKDDGSTKKGTSDKKPEMKQDPKPKTS